MDGSFGMCFLFSWVAAVGRLEPKVAVNCCGPYPWEKIAISCTDMWVIQGLLWPVSHSHPPRMVDFVDHAQEQYIHLPNVLSN